ncbi:MAG: hypothetical protein HQ582_30955 [Planctomycetes bacterium]|nr:hypothetical protein [Planctomycetota bacterium]
MKTGTSLLATLLLAVLPTVANAEVTVTAPAARERLQANTNYEVRWIGPENPPSGSNLVQIKLLLGDQMLYQEGSFAPPTPRDGLYPTAVSRVGGRDSGLVNYRLSWRVPLTCNQSSRRGTSLVGAALRLRVDMGSVEYGDSPVITVSDSGLSFSRLTVGGLGNRPLWITHEKLIKWNGYGLPRNTRVRLLLHRRGVTDRIAVLVEGLHVDDEFRWTVGNELRYVFNHPGHGYYLKVETTDGRLSAETPTFSIHKPTLRVTHPNADVTWHRDNRVSFRWLTSYLAGPVKLELGRGDGGDWKTWYVIKESTRQRGYYEWKVFPKPGFFGPGEIWSDGLNLRFRVSSLVIPEFYDVSDGTIDIRY